MAEISQIVSLGPFSPKNLLPRCKTMDLYRGANRQLDRINSDYPVVTGAGRVSDAAGVFDKRRLEERNILQSMKWAHEGFKEPFRVRFIETLQNLLALQEWVVRIMEGHVTL